MPDLDNIIHLLDSLPHGPDGVILPETLTAAQRFQSAAKTILFPLLREMAHAFTNVGLDAKPFLEFDSDPPVVGICFETLPLSLQFAPSTNPRILTFAHTTKWAGARESHEISYRTLTHEKIRVLIEQALTHALSPRRPPF
jgi:hypothetical protein